MSTDTEIDKEDLLPPFVSEEPVVQFEIHNQITIPESLRTYLLTVSRQLPQCMRTYSSHALDSALLFEPVVPLHHLLMGDEGIGGASDALPRLLPPGTWRRALFDAATGGKMPWRVKHDIPFYIAMEVLRENPSSGTQVMRPCLREHVKLLSVRRVVRDCRSETTAPLATADFLQKFENVTGITSEQMHMADDGVNVDVVSLYKDRLYLVVSEGPWWGWVVGSQHIDNIGFLTPYPTFDALLRVCAAGIDRVQLYDDDHAQVDEEHCNKIRDFVGIELMSGNSSLDEPGTSSQSDGFENHEVSSPSLALPPFHSEEPILRYEATVGIRLPEDLRHYLLSVSREFPVEPNASKHGRTALLYRVCEKDEEELYSYEAEGYTRQGCEAIIDRYMPPGSRGREMYETHFAGCAASSKVSCVPYILAYVDLQRDPTVRTVCMKSTQERTTSLRSLGSNALDYSRDTREPADINVAAKAVARFLCKVMDITGMTIGQLVFPACSVTALRLSSFDTGYGEVLLVTSSGPYYGWIIGTHILHPCHYSSAFPSFFHYRTFCDVVKESPDRALLEVP